VEAERGHARARRPRLGEECATPRTPAWSSRRRKSSHASRWCTRPAGRSRARASCQANAGAGPRAASGRSGSRGRSRRPRRRRRDRARARAGAAGRVEQARSCGCTPTAEKTRPGQRAPRPATSSRSPGRSPARGRADAARRRGRGPPRARSPRTSQVGVGVDHGVLVRQSSRRLPVARRSRKLRGHGHARTHPGRRVGVATSPHHLRLSRSLPAGQRRRLRPERSRSRRCARIRRHALASLDEAVERCAA